MYYHEVFIHQKEEGHGANIGPTFLEVRGDVRVGSIKEEGKEVDDILVGRNLVYMYSFWNWTRVCRVQT